MTKADIIDSVAAQAELTKRKAAQIVELVLAEIKSSLQKGERVALTPFGTFVVRERKAREGRNPKTGAAIDIPARRVAAFVAGAGLKSAVTGGRGAVRKSGKKDGRKR